MKKLAGVSFLAILLVAWTYSPTAPSGDMVHFEDGPFPVSGTVACTGEAFTGEQSYKGHYKMTDLKNGGFRYIYHYQYQFDLIGTSGRKYNGQGVTNENFNLFPGEVYYYRVHNKLIAQGEGEGDDDFHYYATLRVHVLPDGTLQTFLDEESWECR